MTNDATLQRTNCNCIQNELARLEKEQDTDVVHVNYLYLGFAYKLYTQYSGELSQRWSHEGKDFEYCPFCGKKYKQRKPKNDN